MRHRPSVSSAFGAVALAVACAALPATSARAGGATICAYPKPIHKGNNACTAAGFIAGDTFAGIDTALEHVASGGSIQVEPGTYSDALTISSLTNLSIFGDPAKAERPVITFAANSSNTTTLAANSGTTGLLLRHLDIRQTGANGTALTVGGFGSADTTTLEDLVISSVGSGARVDGAVTATGLTASAADGSGLTMSSGNLTLTHSSVSTTSIGGGLSTTGPPALVAIGQFALDDVTVTAPASDRGIGVLVSSNSNSSVAKHLRITAGGVGIRTYPSMSAGIFGFSLADSQIVASAATGLGIRAASSTQVAISGSTVVSGGTGVFVKAGGYDLAEPGSQGPVGAAVTLTNSIVRGSAADLAVPAPAADAKCYDASAQSVPCLPGSLAVDHSDFRTAFDAQIVDGGGNISGDPRFVNGAIGASQDFHLQPGSPAIDSAAAVPAGTLDLDGVARPFGGLPDMGAFESTYVTPTPTPTPEPTPTAAPEPTPTPEPTPPSTAAPLPLAQGGVKLPPSNAFSIVGKPKEGAKGAISFVLALPGPGTVAIVSTLPAAKPKKGSKKRATSAPPASFGSVEAAPASKGNATVILAPSTKGAAAVNALKGSKTFTIAVAITFTPTGGTAKTIPTTVKVGVPPKTKQKSKTKT